MLLESVVDFKTDASTMMRTNSGRQLQTTVNKLNKDETSAAHTIHFTCVACNQVRVVVVVIIIIIINFASSQSGLQPKYSSRFRYTKA